MFAWYAYKKRRAQKVDICEVYMNKQESVSIYIINRHVHPRGMGTSPWCGNCVKHADRRSSHKQFSGHSLDTYLTFYQMCTKMYVISFLFQLKILHKNFLDSHVSHDLKCFKMFLNFFRCMKMSCMRVYINHFIFLVCTCFRILFPYKYVLL